MATTFYIIKEKQSLFSKLQKVIKNLFLFLMPWYLYQSLIRFLGYTPHDDLANTWGQFRWIANYLIRPVNFLSDKIIGQPVLDKKITQEDGIVLSYQTTLYAILLIIYIRLFTWVFQ